MKNSAKALLGSLLFCATSAGHAQEAPRPNFLFIITDDQRYDALGVVQREQGDKARFPWFQTPNTDRLAAEGVRFRNAFVVSSLCAPSRAAFLTGKYNHRNGVANNFTAFPPDNVTWATELRKAGYTTGYIGKWHMGNQRGQRPGFDYSASFIGHARYHDAPVEINGEAKPTRGWVDDVSTDFAIDFIKQHKAKPWAMVVGYKTPHGPWEPPQRLAEKYAGEEANAVPNLNLPPGYRDDKRTQSDAPPQGKVKVNLNYFRCLAGVDENVGRLLKTLDDEGETSDTMVIYVSDNGYYHGEHRLGDKRSAYEESMRIPLLVRYPRLNLKNATEDRIALNIDLAPTLLDFAGAKIPPEMQGTSWRPLLEQKPAPWRDRFFYEYFWEQQQGGSPPTMTALRTTNAKLIKYQDHEEWTELFDLQADPYETKNLWNDPAHAALRATLEAAYEKEKTAVGYVVPPYASNPAQFATRQPLNAWVLEYRFDKDEDSKARDASGKSNHGTIKNAPLAAGRNGSKARRFAGDGSIEVPKSDSLRPDVGAWTVEATFKSDKPDGVIVARGGATNGYGLFLQDGKLVFVVNANNQTARVAAPLKNLAEWTTATARITADKKLTLSIDGKEAARAPLRVFIDKDPNDSMQIGADSGSPVVQGVPAFQGLIESVRIYSGAAP